MTAAALQPPFAYFGGKTTLATRIVDLLPRTSTTPRCSAEAAVCC